MHPNEVAGHTCPSYPCPYCHPQYAWLKPIGRAAVIDEGNWDAAVARIAELELEIAESKRELEDALGTPPDASFSLHALVLHAVSALDAT